MRVKRAFNNDAVLGRKLVAIYLTIIIAVLLVVMWPILVLEGGLSFANGFVEETVEEHFSDLGARLWYGDPAFSIASDTEA